MTVYGILKNNHIIAISESKYETMQFYFQNNLCVPQYTVFEETGSKANNIMIVFDDLILEEYNEGIVRRCDINDIESIVIDIHDKLVEISDILDSISDYINIENRKPVAQCKRCATFLEQNKYNINISNIIREYYANKDLRNDNLFNDIISNFI